MKGRSHISTAPREDILWSCYTKLIHQSRDAMHCILLPSTLCCYLLNIDFSSSHMSMRI